MLAAVRVRGKPDTRDSVEDVLDQLGLEQKNHGAVLPDTATFRGMLQKAKDVITYGEIDTAFATELLEARGKTQHGDLDETVEEIGYDDVADLVEAIEAGDASLSDLKDAGWRTTVRLTPPSKGYSDTRRHYQQGGSLGNRGEAIEDLLQRMH